MLLLHDILPYLRLKAMEPADFELQNSEVMSQNKSLLF
jgi:hypothetical protein